MHLVRMVPHRIPGRQGGRQEGREGGREGGRWERVAGRQRETARAMEGRMERERVCVSLSFRGRRIDTVEYDPFDEKKYQQSTCITHLT